MPSRVIRADINSSDSLSKVSMQAELTFDRLILAVDDFGRLDARPQVLKAQLFPLRDEVKPKDVVKWVYELSALDDAPVRLYEVGGRPYLVLTGWEKHRGKGRRATESKYPTPPEAMPKTASAEILGKAMQSSEKQCNPPEGRGTRSEKREAGDEGVAVQAPTTPEWSDQIASRLWGLVEANVPGARKPRSLAAWGREIAQIPDDPVEIAATVAWLFAVNTEREFPFVVQSARSLRDKYGRIQAARKPPPRSNTRSTTTQGWMDTARELFEESRSDGSGEGVEVGGADGNVHHLRPKAG